MLIGFIVSTFRLDQVVQVWFRRLFLTSEEKPQVGELPAQGSSAVRRPEESQDPVPLCLGRGFFAFGTPYAEPFLEDDQRSRVSFAFLWFSLVFFGFALVFFGFLWFSLALLWFPLALLWFKCLTGFFWLSLCSYAMDNCFGLPLAPFSTGLWNNPEAVAKSRGTEREPTGNQPGTPFNPFLVFAGGPPCGINHFEGGPTANQSFAGPFLGEHSCRSFGTVYETLSV